MEEISELQQRKDEIIQQISTFEQERDFTLKELNSIYKKGKATEYSPIKLSNTCYELISKISSLKEELVKINRKIEKLERGL